MPSDIPEQLLRPHAPRVSTTTPPVQIIVDDLSAPRIATLLGEHLAEMQANSPACSMHALDLEALRAPGITFWSVSDATDLLGCGALRQLDPTHGEIKSMRTAAAHTGRGVAAHLLDHIITTARARGYRRLSLETGASDFYGPAQRLYARNGFERCAPFADYTDDPHSVYMTRTL
ncbi:GNAT family N-acetyltransferase [Nocardia sp. NPDC051463]|uniref:GNAT family N-acetyltransferase n=1 Tax=Nocardia sp. NPDC051463 TaxID=3154845 RepID=UPI00344A139A